MMVTAVIILFAANLIMGYCIFVIDKQLILNRAWRLNVSKLLKMQDDQLELINKKVVILQDGIRKISDKGV